MDLLDASNLYNYPPINRHGPAPNFATGMPETTKDLREKKRVAGNPVFVYVSHLGITLANVSLIFL